MSDILIQTLLQGHQQNPQDIALLLSLAAAYEANDQIGEALESYQKVVAIDGKHLDGIEHVIRLAKHLENESLVKAYIALKDAAMSQASAKTLDLNSKSNASSVNDEEPKRVRGQKLTLVTNNGEDRNDNYIEAEDTHIYLKDVGGMLDVKKRLNLTFLAPLKNPKLVKKYGKKTAGGLLLYGPPGCGKTYIARALAGELGAKFISVSLSDILDMYIGESEKKLHEVFDMARRNAPAVLFFDELDAIGQKRSNLKHSGMRSLVNQLLMEMDSVDGNNEGVFILAATNLPWDIDAALKRPGRFDRVIAVFPPDQEAREHILEHHLRDTPYEDVDLKALAEGTELFSGADLAHLCQSAIEVVFEESLETGNARALNNKDFQVPLKEVRPSTRSWFESARNYAMFANQGGSYDDLLNYIRERKL